MSIVTPLRVAEITTTEGILPLTLAGAVNASFRTFAAHYGSGTSWLYYVIEWAGGFEIGRGSFNGSTTLTRSEVMFSSAGNAHVNLPAGAKTAFALLDLGQPEWNFTTSIGPAEVGRLPGATARFTGTVAATAAMPAVAQLPRGFAVQFVNAGTANMTIDPDGAETIGGATTLVLLPGQTATAVRRPGGWDAIDAAVRRAGDTMTGFLTLHADPTAALHAATKLYVDQHTRMVTWHGYNLEDGVSAVLPAGGTWAWFLFSINTSGNVSVTNTGIHAGGTTVLIGSSGWRLRGFAWRYV